MSINILILLIQKISILLRYYEAARRYEGLNYTTSAPRRQKCELKFCSALCRRLRIKNGEQKGLRPLVVTNRFQKVSNRFGCKRFKPFRIINGSNRYASGLSKSINLKLYRKSYKFGITRKGKKFM